MVLPRPAASAAFRNQQCSPCKSCIQICSSMQTFKEGCGLCSSIADIQIWLYQLQHDAIKLKQINLQLQQDRKTAVKQAQFWKDKVEKLTDKNNTLEEQHQKLGLFMSCSPIDVPPTQSVRCPTPPPPPYQPCQPDHPPPLWLAITKKTRQARPSKSIHRMAKSLSCKRRLKDTASCKAKKYAVPICRGVRSFPIGMGKQYPVPKGFFLSD